MLCFEFWAISDFEPEKVTHLSDKTRERYSKPFSSWAISISHAYDFNWDMSPSMTFWDGSCTVCSTTFNRSWMDFFWFFMSKITSKTFPKCYVTKYCTVSKFSRVEPGYGFKSKMSFKSLCRLWTWTLDSYGINHTLNLMRSRSLSNRQFHYFACMIQCLT